MTGTRDSGSLKTVTADIMTSFNVTIETSFVSFEDCLPPGTWCKGVTRHSATLEYACRWYDIVQSHSLDGLCCSEGCSEAESFCQKRSDTTVEMSHDHVRATIH